jgi:hypothetical protein
MQFHYKPGQALRIPGSWDSQIRRQSTYEGSKVVSPTHRPPLPSENIPGTHFCWRLSRSHAHSAAGRALSIENSNDIIRNQTRDLLACSAVPQPTAPPAACLLSISSGFFEKRCKYSTKLFFLQTYLLIFSFCFYN